MSAIRLSCIASILWSYIFPIARASAKSMLACVLVVVVVGSVGTAGQEATVSRGVGDVFTISSPDGVCVNVSCGDYETYMVEDGVCVADNTLQSKDIEMLTLVTMMCSFRKVFSVSGTCILLRQCSHHCKHISVHS